MTDDKFKEIRPYSDEESVAALKRIAAHPVLSQIAAFLFPGQDPALFRSMIANLEGVDDFQSNVMAVVINKILKDTSGKLTFSGVEKLDKDKKYLYISNHRDIMLDSAIMQVILFEAGLGTSEMAVGDNLITDPLLEDIARVNKMIKVIRNTNSREIYNSSVLLSEYIRHRLEDEISSVWIAQRNGRTKDGVDFTEQGLLKMLDMSGKGDFVSDFDELAIVPVSVSYEYEPCDILKAKELYVSRRQKYVKSEGEDLNSVLTGIMQFKGNIHFNFCDPISREELQKCSEFEKNEKFKALGEIIDKRIISTFRLWNTSYMAYDMLTGSDRFKDNYSVEEMHKFREYIDFKLSGTEDDSAETQEILLSIYANPIITREKLEL